MSPEMYEDCHSFLLETILREHHKWDKEKHPKFSDWVRVVVSKRILNYWRKELGRGKQPRPKVLSYDEVEKELDTLESPDFQDDSDMRVAFAQTCAMLSPKSMWILETMAVPKSEGYSISDIAKQHDKPNRWVRERLAELRQELEELGIEL